MRAILITTLFSKKSTCQLVLAAGPKMSCLIATQDINKLMWKYEENIIF
jgi:hypothetical protein